MPDCLTEISWSYPKVGTGVLLFVAEEMEAPRSYAIYLSWSTQGEARVLNRSALFPYPPSSHIAQAALESKVDAKCEEEFRSFTTFWFYSSNTLMG